MYPVSLSHMNAAGTAVSSSTFSRLTVTSRVSSAPSARRRSNASRTEDFFSPARVRSSSIVLRASTACPSMATSSSPGSTPALAADEPSPTESTTGDSPTMVKSIGTG
jgi:hypothetical protein